MSFPLEDAGFTLWHSDLDTQLKMQLGVTSRELGVDRRSLQQRYYGGENVFTVLQAISRQFRMAQAV